METQIEYALVDYDVHKDRSIYPLIYKHLKKVALLFTESVYMVNLGEAARVDKAFREINKDLLDAGKPQMTFNVTVIAERETEKMRARSVKALAEFAQFVGKSLLDRIERLEAKFNSNLDDPNAHIKKKGNALSRATRELNMARGLATLFLIEKEVEAAVEATQKILEARKELFTEEKKKQIEENAKS